MASLANTSETASQGPYTSDMHTLVDKFKEWLSSNNGPSTQPALGASVAHTSGNLSAFVSASNPNYWLVDSGATDHMTAHSNLLYDITRTSQKQSIGIANGDRVLVEGVGKMNLFSSTSDALLIPNLSSNLLSVSKITKKLNCNAIFSPYDVVFQDLASGMILGEGKERGGLYVMDTDSFAKVFHARMDKDQDSLLWHRRTGHPSDKIFAAFRF